MGLIWNTEKYVEQFLLALKKELKIKENKSGERVRLSKAELLRESTANYVYRFVIKSQIPLGDSKLKLEADHKEYDCSLISFTPKLTIELSFANKLPSALSEIWLIYDNTQLLRTLISKYEGLQKNKAYEKFASVTRIFNGKLTGNSNGIELKFLPTNLNKYQISAVKDSLQGDAIIWGPPGTGKTQMISAAICNHIYLKNRILLLSHANTAVDGAFERLVQELHESEIYKNGRIVRLGEANNVLVEQYPMISLDNIIRMRVKELVPQLDEYQKELKAKNQYIENLRQVYEQKNLCQRLRKTCEDLQEQLTDWQKKYEEVCVRISSYQCERIQMERDLERVRSMGILRKLFLAINEDVLKERLLQLERDQRFDEAALEQGIKTQRKYQQEIAEANNLYQIEQDRLNHSLMQLGINEQEPDKLIHKLNAEIKVLQQKIAGLEKTIKEMESTVLNEAVVIGATLAKTYMSHSLNAQSFDSVFVDEVSMASLPVLFWACSLAKKYYVFIGDFLQLPPIAENDKDEIYTHWICNSLFNLLDFNNVQECMENPYVAALRIQYRMNPDIAGIANKLFYKDILENGDNTHSNLLFDDYTSDNPLALLDTSLANPQTILSDNRRFCFYHAYVAAKLGVHYLQTNANITVGITTPYRAQAELIQDLLRFMCKDNCLDATRATINTVHKFQGGQCDVIIFDVVDTLIPEWRKEWFFLRTADNPNANLMINVAITRAKSKFILVGNADYIRKKFAPSEPLLQVLNILSEKGAYVDAGTIEPYFTALDDKSLRLALSGTPPISHYDKKSFWPKFINDLESAQNQIIIFCAYLTGRRVAMLKPVLQAASKRLVKIILITRPVEQHKLDYQDSIREILKTLCEIPIVVKIQKKIHQKVILIDDTIAWEGSLNILSHTDTGEQMVRLTGTDVVVELSKCVKFDNALRLNDYIAL